MNTPGSVIDNEQPLVEAAPDTPAPGRIGRGLIAVVRGYQLARTGRPSGCRYLPTCSEYAIGAVSEHGPARGSLLAARRLMRCTPWGGHGIDPVPAGRASCTRH